ncbi:7-cyano-7-deazaguanine synthase [hydrothermal vent metagenome]|uniref:7-cyano-7-deazaguanine synthase n=1 Tax=hydrothermal vent metagenome TaxID=652676 RepID=A0A3B1DCD6_9ZZZZ
MNKKAIVLFSGGLDSTTILYYAKDKGFEPYCLIFDYGQRHRKEINLAKTIAKQAGCDFKVVKISLPWLGSSLLDKSMDIPMGGAIDEKKIPSTYVPARNIIFLSFAASYAEAVGARAIFIGANAIDYSGYPDCRPEFFEAYQQTLKTGLKTGVEHKAIKIHIPLIHKTKAQIIKMGLKLNVPYDLTWSCYRGGKHPCGKCDSCVLRLRGFEQVGTKDPTL